MDIVERLRKDARGPALEAADEIERLRWENANMEKLWGKSEGTWMGIRDQQDAEIEQLREDLDLIKKMARAEIDAKLRYAAALRNIADIEHEDLAAPKSHAEAVLWVCLDRCVTLAENALKWKE